MKWDLPTISILLHKKFIEAHILNLCAQPLWILVLTSTVFDETVSIDDEKHYGELLTRCV